MTTIHREAPLGGRRQNMAAKDKRAERVASPTLSLAISSRLRGMNINSFEETQICCVFCFSAF